MVGTVFVQAAYFPDVTLFSRDDKSSRGLSELSIRNVSGGLFSCNTNKLDDFSPRISLPASSPFFNVATSLAAKLPDESLNNLPSHLSPFCLIACSLQRQDYFLHDENIHWYFDYL